MKWYFLFLMLVSFYRSNGQQDSIIKWAADRRLTYDDFQGQRPIPEMNHDDFDTLAAITCSISYIIVAEKGKFRVLSYAYTNRQKSWMDEKNPFVLRHEQGHFDIAEIYSRRFQKIISDTSIADVGTYLTFVNHTLEQIFFLINAEDKQYDLYTMNTLGRQYYDKWISEELKIGAR